MVPAMPDKKKGHCLVSLVSVDTRPIIWPSQSASCGLMHVSLIPIRSSIYFTYESLWVFLYSYI